MTWKEEYALTNTHKARSIIRLTWNKLNDSFTVSDILTKSKNICTWPTYKWWDFENILLTLYEMVNNKELDVKYVSFKRIDGYVTLPLFSKL